jgi:Polysaccharide lyase
MIIFNKKNNLTLFSLLLLSLSCKAQLNVYDGFETPALSKLWTKDRMVKDALQIQSAVVRKGHSAAKITLNAGDIYEPGSERGIATERDELRESKNYVSAEGKTYEYKFSLFLPDSFPIVPVRLVIAQWKQYCESDTCSANNPVLAIRYVSGQLYITVQTDSAKTTIYQTSDEIRSKWLDFRFRIRFSRFDNGQVNAWLNDEQIISFKGVTCYSFQKGYNEKGRFYFKTGLYRDLMTEPMTIYIDEYSKTEIIEK